MAGIPDTIARLVDTFDRNKHAYKAQGYKEAQLRQEFINPLFEALGWDVSNRHGHAEAYKDVVHEDALKIGATTRAPDYCFRIGGTRKFFLEAKKPAVNIDTDVSAAYQLRRYAWSAKLPLSILSDFEEFAVYDCRIPPKQKDKPTTARVSYITYDQYESKWDEIASVFSKDAILTGSFDKYVESNKRKRGTSEVDSEFLSEIEQWRELLAKSLALRNPTLDVYELNFAVQTTIDRIIFLRMCEDRGIEPYGQLQALLSGPGTYGRLRKLYRDADHKYNSGLFHFEPEKGRHSQPDELTPTLAIDDKVLQTIIRRLYYPDSPYEFSVLPPEILGHVYEQFLGKVIRLTDGHQAKIEEKPEVKKAGGVYYTPSYIVDYIVQHTVGKLCQGKTLAQVAKLRILDPACGSGSFLLGAYQYLLDWHLKQYTAIVEKGGKAPTVPPPKGQRKRKSDSPVIRQLRKNEYRLTTAEKKRILLNNIYGVDIDSQAVEVTKLSLLLKVLEGENKESLARTLFAHERALPDLDSNIKCGNSLIGPDYHHQRLLPLSDKGQRIDKGLQPLAPAPTKDKGLQPLAQAPTPDKGLQPPARASKKHKGLKPLAEKQHPPAPSDAETRRINAFDWPAEFPEIMKAKTPGFHAVIGNPPYVRIQAMKEWAPTEVEFYKKAYKSASAGNYDLYVVFIEKGLQLLNKQGLLGFICPHKFFTAVYGEPLRQLVSDGRHLAQIVHFGDEQVFAGATTYTCMIFLDKSSKSQFDFSTVDHLSAWRQEGRSKSSPIPAEATSRDAWTFHAGDKAALLEKLRVLKPTLGDVAKVFVGTQTSADTVFVLDKCRFAKGYVTGMSKSLGKEVRIEAKCVTPFLRGKDIRRYKSLATTSMLICPYKISETTSQLYSFLDFSRLYPDAAEYLRSNKEALASREKGKFDNEHWHAFGYPKSMTLFQKEKIIVPDYNNEASFTIDDGSHFFKTGYGLLLNDDSLSPFFVLGLLNSSLLFWYLTLIGTSLRGGYVRFWRQYIEQLPIRLDACTNPKDRSRHDQVVSMVEQMLDLQKKVANAKTPNDKTRLQRQIGATDKQIDQRVYELYGLTDKEIKIVEEATR